MPKPQNVPEGILYAHTTVNSIVASTTNALNAHAIDSKDAEYVRKAAGDTRDILEAAELAINVGDITTAEARLKLAQGVLQSLKDYLSSQGVQ